MTPEELFNNRELNQETILNLVDEYTLYCYYTNINDLVLGKAYNVPYYRQDIFPSFSVFESKSNTVDYMWKDHATGESGSIFQLIKRIEGLNSISEVYAKINEDFALGYNYSSPGNTKKISWYNKPVQNNIKIRVGPSSWSQAGIDFWKQFDVHEDLLDLYKVSQIEYAWYYDLQQSPQRLKDPSFTYSIGAFYQIYSPYEDKRYKFRNDLPDNYFFGYLQLPETASTLIIDKSMKDVIFCRRLGLYAISPKSENTFIPSKKMEELRQRFNRIIIMLDNDKAGRDATDRYLKLYPWLESKFLDQAKDKSDLARLSGVREAERIIKELIK